MDWRLKARCRDHDTNTFYPVSETGPSLGQISEARTICQACPVAADCLTWALIAEPYGIHGGMTETERDQLLRGTLTN